MLVRGRLIVGSKLSHLQVNHQFHNDLFRIDQDQDLAIRGLLRDPQSRNLRRPVSGRHCRSHVQTVVGKLVELADQFGIEVIAEGVETAETVQGLKAMGIYLMQGYYFDRPSALMKV